MPLQDAAGPGALQKFCLILIKAWEEGGSSSPNSQRREMRNEAHGFFCKVG